jgi:hypothetical protein
MPADTDLALASPPDDPLIFRTEVRPYLYLASAGLLVLGLMFVDFFLWGPPDQGIVGAPIAAVGVFMLYIAWVNFRAVRAGYPRLILEGHRLTERTSAAFRRDLDLSALGETKIVILTGDKGSQRLYLGFLPLPGRKLRPRPFTAPKLQQFADTILLNGYVGNNLARAKDIERVINARREQPVVTTVPSIARGQSAARVRLVVTAGVFAALWIALVWWRLLP